MRRPGYFCFPSSYVYTYDIFITPRQTIGQSAWGSSLNLLFAALKLGPWRVREEWVAAPTWARSHSMPPKPYHSDLHILWGQPYRRRTVKSIRHLSGSDNWSGTTPLGPIGVPATQVTCNDCADDSWCTLTDLSLSILGSFPG